MIYQIVVNTWFWNLSSGKNKLNFFFKWQILILHKEYVNWVVRYFTVKKQEMYNTHTYKDLYLHADAVMSKITEEAPVCNNLSNQLNKSIRLQIKIKEINNLVSRLTEIYGLINKSRKK